VFDNQTMWDPEEAERNQKGNYTVIPKGYGEMPPPKWRRENPPNPNYGKFVVYVSKVKRTQEQKALMESQSLGKGKGKRKRKKPSSTAKTGSAAKQTKPSSTAKTGSAAYSPLCTMELSFDFLLCANNTSYERMQKNFFLEDHLSCGGALAKTPITTSLIKNDESGDCKKWFSLMDGAVRSLASLVRGAQVARLSYKCFEYEAKQPEFGEGQGRRGGGGGGGMGSSSSFTMSSNRGGNSEALL